MIHLLFILLQFNFIYISITELYISAIYNDIIGFLIMSNKKNMNNSEQNFSFLDDSPSEKEDASEEEDFYAIDEI